MLSLYYLIFIITFFIFLNNKKTSNYIMNNQAINASYLEYTFK